MAEELIPIPPDLAKLVKYQAMQQQRMGSLDLVPVSPEEAEQVRAAAGVKRPITKENLGEAASSVASGVGQFLKEAAIPTATAAGGAALGSLLGPGGTVGGGVIGGGLGEGINQALGITEPSAGNIALSAGGALLGPGVQKGAQLAKRGALAAAKVIPGVSGVLKQPVVQSIRRLPSKFLPETGSKQLFGELEGLAETNVKFPKTIALMDELAAQEERIIPGLQSEAIKRSERGGASKLSSGQPEVIDPVRQAQGFPSVVRRAIPDAGVPFEVGQDNVRRLGQRIRQAEAGVTQEDAGSLKRLRGAFMDDMDAATVHLPKLKQANAAFKSEMAVDELTSMIEKGLREVGGKSDIQDFSATTVINKLRLITNPKNPNDYDKLFTKGLGKENLTKLRETLDKINDMGPVSFSFGSGGGRAGSLVMQSIPAAAGGTIGALVGGAPGAAIGALGGAMLPGMIAEGLTKRPAQAFILRAFRDAARSKRPIDVNVFGQVLGSLTSRTAQGGE